MNKEFITAILYFVLLWFGATAARAATCTVNALTDTGAGSGGASGTGDLRYCINQANANAGADVINVTVTGTLMLSATLPQITQSLTINGSGQTSFIIDGANIPLGSPFDASQPFTIGNNGTIAAFNNLTVRNGKSGYQGGGAIRMFGDGSVSTLNLTNVTIDGNTARYDKGGGIYTNNVNVNIANSRIINNKTLGDQGNGSGIGFDSTSGTPRTLFITGTTISGNSTQPPAGNYKGGGGIFNSGGAVRIENSTISGNTVNGQGGGILTQGVAPVLLSNVTISDNGAVARANDSPSQQFGGGLSISSPTTLRNCTIAGNSATTSGGGIDFGSGGHTFANIIVANNTAPTSADTTSSSGTTIRGKNIFKTAQTGSYTYINGGAIQVADPQLNALADNGGLTQTRKLQPTSPAIDTGVDAEALDTQSQFLATDQRGAARVNAVDIGAYEVSPVSVLNSASSGAGSLRQALIDTPTGRSIFFSPAYFNQPRTISLGGSALDIPRDVTISGAGANVLTIDGGNASRIFRVASSVMLTLSGMTLKNGNANGTPEAKGGAIYSDGTVNASNIAVRSSQAPEGGGIYNNGTLNLTASIVADCSSSFGAGIYNAAGKFAAIDASTVSGNNNIGLYNGGTMNVTNSTASGNTGGGILNSATLRLINSTVSGNQSSGKGAGIYNNGGGSVAAVLNSTVTDNRGFGYTGAGVWNDGGSFSVRNSIIDGNFSDQGYAHDFVGGLANLGNNLIGTRNPQLAPLGNYGGATQTHALLPTSAALNAGSNCVLTANGCGNGNAALTLDQRGLGAARKIGANVDIGAFERNLTFDQSALPNGNTGASYSQTLTITRQSSYAEFNGDQPMSDSLNAPFTFSLVPIAGQQLPPGLSLASDGTISGTPMMSGTYIFTVKAADADAMAGVQQYTMQILAPTAAMVSISGRVFAPGDAGLTGAQVTLTDATGTSRTISTGARGAFSFADVAAGETYILSIQSKRYRYAPQIITATEDVTDVRFAPQ